jgi:hypothetical protein
MSDRPDRSAIDGQPADWDWRAYQAVLVASYPPALITQRGLMGDPSLARTAHYPLPADVESGAGNGAEWPVLALLQGFAALMNNFPPTSIRRCATEPPPMTSSWCSSPAMLAAEPNPG